MSLCQFSPARRTPVGRPPSVTLDRTTISGLPGTLQRSPKMLNSISPKRRVKATCCGGVMCWSRKKMTPYWLQARSIAVNVASLSGPARLAPRISAPRAAPVGTISKDIGPPRCARARPSFCRSSKLRMAGRQEPVEHLSRTGIELCIIATVEYSYPVHKDPMHPDRVADRARAAARQVVDAARRRDVDRRGIKQQQIGTGPDRDAAAVGDAVEPGLMAGQAPHPFRQIEGPAFAHPMSEEIQPEPGIAEVDEMRAGIRQRDDAGLVLHKRLDTVIDCIEEAANEPGIEVFFKPEVEQHVERVAPGFARDVRDCTVGESSILTHYGRRDDDALPVALKHRARFRITQIGAEALAEARVAKHRLQLLAVIGLDRVERRVAIERVGAREREVERQRLAGNLDVELVAARLRRGACVEHAERALRVLLVVKRNGGAHEDAAAVPGGDLLHLVGQDRSGRDLDDTAPWPAHCANQGVEFRHFADR